MGHAWRRNRCPVPAARLELSGAQAAWEAIALGEGAELQLEFARVLLVAGQIERRRRRKRAARELLERSLRFFREAGAHRWAELAVAELARVSGRKGEDELTVSERRVAELAASDLTNREVAARLYLSPKTVEVNLARMRTASSASARTPSLAQC